MEYVKINKVQARKLFAEGKAVFCLSFESKSLLQMVESASSNSAR